MNLQGILNLKYIWPLPKDKVRGGNTMGAIWRKEWIRPYESAWSVFEKFSYANIINKSLILRTFGTEEVLSIKNNHLGNHVRDLLTLNGLDELKVTNQFQLNVHSLTRGVIQNLLLPLGNTARKEEWFSLHIRWCPKCILNGYHSLMHQFTLFEICPFHNEPLKDACPACRQKTPYILSDTYMSSAFTCKCGYQYADLSTRWLKWEVDTSKFINTEIAKWIGPEHLKTSNERFIYVPENLNFNMLNQVTEKGKGNPFNESSFFTYKIDPSGDALKDKVLENLYEEIFMDNRQIFKAIDKHIKKTYRLHLHCIKRLQLLLKEEQDDFPPICPIAYAYVFWKQSSLSLPNFYGPLQGVPNRGKEKRQFNVVSLLYIERLSHLFRAANKTLSYFGSVDGDALRWIINKTTAYQLYQLFINWLDFALLNSTELSKPKGNEYEKIIHSNMFFLFVLKREDERILLRFICTRLRKNRETNLNAIDCRRWKNKRKSMRSYIPLAVSMMNDHKHKELQVYVDQYVTKLNL